MTGFRDSVEKALGWEVFGKRRLGFLSDVFVTSCTRCDRSKIPFRFSASLFHLHAIEYLFGLFG